MKMGEEDGIYIARRDGGRFQAGQEPAHVRRVARAAGIDENRAPAGRHEIGVDARRDRRRFDELGGEHRVGLVRRDVGKISDVDLQEPVRDRGDDRLPGLDALQGDDLRRRRYADRSRSRQNGEFEDDRRSERCTDYLTT